MIKINRENILFIFKKSLPILLLVLLATVFYSQTSSFKLTYLDDQSLIGENFSVIKEVSIPKIFSSDPFFSESPVFYRPLLSLSFWLDYHLSGGNWHFFHWHSICLNALMTVLVFLFFKKIGFKKKPSWFAAAIFSVHPVLLPAIAWLPGRNDLLLGVFSLAAIIFFLYFQETKNKKFLNLHLIFWLMALFSKETAVFLPLVLIPLIPNIFDRQNFLTEIKKPTFIATILFWITGAASYLLLRFGTIGTKSIFDINKLFSGLSSSILAIITFLGKFFWPFNLSTLPVTADSSIWPGLIIVITLALVFWKFRKKINKPLFLFGIFWFLIFLIPSLIFQNNPDFGVSFNLDHRLYLPAVGLLIIILSFPKIAKRIFNPIAFSILIISITLSFLRINDYSNQYSFWEKAVEHSPSSAFAHNNLGAMYYLDGEKDLALSQYFQALTLNPNEKLVHNNIGLYMTDLNRDNLAKQYFEQELKINPGYQNSINSLYYLANKESAIDIKK